MAAGRPGGRRRERQRSKEKCMFGVGSDLEASGLCSSDRTGTSEGGQEREGSRATRSPGLGLARAVQGPSALWPCGVDSAPAHFPFLPKHQYVPAPPPALKG